MPGVRNVSFGLPDSPLGQGVVTWMCHSIHLCEHGLASRDPASQEQACFNLTFRPGFGKHIIHCTEPSG